jgi:hypothetical protein
LTVETTFRDTIGTALKAMSLHEYDWNGNCGLPLRGDVADLAHDLFVAPETLFLSGFNLLPTPTVVMGGNGTVEIGFDSRDGRELVITVQCEGVITYVKVYEDDQTSVEGTVRLDPLESFNGTAGFSEFVELLLWVIDSN